MAETKRISKSVVNTLKGVLPDAAEKLQFLADDYGFKSFTYRLVDSSHKFYLGEGDRFHVVSPEGSGEIEVVAEHNLGAAGVSHSIGKGFNVPVGSFVFHVWYMGKYFLTVYHVGDKSII